MAVIVDKEGVLAFIRHIGGRFNMQEDDIEGLVAELVSFLVDRPARPVEIKSSRVWHDGSSTDITYTGRTVEAWRSMESAPRDGTKFLLAEGVSQIVSWWHKGYWHLGGQSWLDGTNLNPKLRWQPLPPPPLNVENHL